MLKSKKQYLLPLQDKKKAQITLLAQGAEIKKLEFSKLDIAPETKAELYTQTWKSPWPDTNLEILMFPYESYLSITCEYKKIKELAVLIDAKEVIEITNDFFIKRYFLYCREKNSDPKNIISFKSRS